MPKDLTTSKIDRQNILNNNIALAEIQKKTDFKGIFWNGRLMFTREMVASFFDVDIRTIGRYIEQNNEELAQNGYEVLRGKKLKSFLEAMATVDGKDINVPTKISILGVFDFHAFLNLAMLLSESEKARILRQMMLDIVIDIINQKTGGATKYINQRDKDFISASLQEDNYRCQFTDALKKYVLDDQRKYARLTDKIYVSIFKEKAREYKSILDLKDTENARDTFYSEILDIIAAYESGLAEEIKRSYKTKGNFLTNKDVDEIFSRFESLALWKPLIHHGREKMASRDLALREAFHYQLSEYIQPLKQDEYEKFLGAASDELERLMEENSSVLKRLKERE
jgi:hypothetical protein